MATTQTLERARPNGKAERIVWCPEGATQSFKQGQFVYKHTDGTILACADDATTIFGMALADASGTTNTSLPICVATDTQEFVMNMYHATAGSAVLAETQLDAKWGLEVDSNRCYVDVGQGSADAFMIVDYLDPIGDTYAKVLAVVLPEVQQLGATGA